MKAVRVFALVVLVCLISDFSVAAKPLKLTRSQLKALNRKLPAKVRKFLETADSFEILTDTIAEKPEEKPVYIPNKRFVIKKAATRASVLEAFYREAAVGGGGAACFYPNHSIVARKGKRFVRLTICYTCGEFGVSGSFGSWMRGFSTSDPILSEAIINRLLEKYGMPVKAL
jgi:hypothetical protein